jgi:hypothetical protein
MPTNSNATTSGHRRDRIKCAPLVRDKIWQND